MRSRRLQALWSGPVSEGFRFREVLEVPEVFETSEVFEIIDKSHESPLRSFWKPGETYDT